MGKRKSQFKKRNANKVLKLGTSESTDNRTPYEEILRENKKFEHYYQKIGICKTEEWNDFLTHLKSDLPTTFRITGSKCVASKLVDIVKGQYLKELLNQDENSKTFYSLPWYPNNLAWQMNVTKREIRGKETYYKLHNFLMTETENGTISRQETVSMIPPIVLDIKPHHKVLDMCAAPGSKTAQLLEFLHADETAIPKGYVIANDVDNKRCYMLVHQAKRLNSPCIAIINHDSSILPNLTSTIGGKNEQVQFDRILCDVPCSGDGTLRKNPDIWGKWTQATALNFHGIQSRILRRGCELLKTGGRLVYSTCSLNPLEDEAVIHRLLVECAGAMKLVDVSQSLPGLKFCRGMENWLVASKNLDFYETYEDVDEKWNTTISSKMFPPKSDERHKYELHKCIRILPHQQNTGAFFVAVLEKQHPIHPKEKSFTIVPNQETTQTETFDPKLPENQRRRRRQNCFREDPFVFFDENEEVFQGIKDFYKLDDAFDCKCLLVRCKGGKKKNVYLTSPEIRDLIVNNESTIKFVNSGVKLFVRSDNRNMKKCPFRIANDGLESILPSLGTGRKVRISRTDLVTLLYNDNPDKAPKFSELSEGVQEQVKEFDAGSCILVYEEDCNDENAEKFVLHLSGWKGTHSLRAYMARCGTVHLLRLLGEDVTKYERNKFLTKNGNGALGDDSEAGKDADENIKTENEDIKEDDMETKENVNIKEENVEIKEENVKTKEENVETKEENVEIQQESRN